MSAELKILIDNLRNFNIKIQTLNVLPKESKEMLEYLNNKTEIVFRAAQQDLLTFARFSNDSMVDSVFKDLELANDLYTCVRNWCILDQAESEETPCIILNRKLPYYRFFSCPFTKSEAVPLQSDDITQRVNALMLNPPRIILGLGLTVSSKLRLPVEILTRFVETNLSAALQVNRQFRRVALGIFQSHWLRLKQASPSGLVNMPLLMEIIEKKFSNRSVFVWFKALRSAFIEEGALISKGECPVSLLEFQELQSQAAKAAEDDALLISCEKATETPFVNANQARTWVNDPANFPFVQGITGLILDNSKMKVLPKEIGLFISLLSLRLNNNQLRFLPIEIASLTLLQSLRLNNNLLTSLPDEICLMSRLQELSVSENQLTSLPKRIGDLRMLSKLVADDNQLRTLPRRGLPSGLRKLSLCLNELKSIPDQVRSLTRLKTLELEGNQIDCIPDFILEISDLELNLGFNEIRSVPESLKNSNVTVILDGNPITFLPIGHQFNFSTQLQMKRNKKEMEYPAISALGKLYQAILRRERNIEELCFALDDIDHKQIFDTCGQVHDDKIKRVYAAVRERIEKQLERSDTIFPILHDSRSQTSLLTYIINQIEGRGANYIHLPFDNLPLLADALMYLRQDRLIIPSNENAGH